MGNWIGVMASFKFPFGLIWSIIYGDKYILFCFLFFTQKGDEVEKRNGGFLVFFL